MERKNLGFWGDLEAARVTTTIGYSQRVESSFQLAFFGLPLPVLLRGATEQNNVA